MYKTSNCNVSKIGYPKNLKTLLFRSMELFLMEKNYMKIDEIKLFRTVVVPELMKMIDEYIEDKNDVINDRLLVRYINDSLMLRKQVFTG